MMERPGTQLCTNTSNGFSCDVVDRHETRSRAHLISTNRTSSSTCHVPPSPASSPSPRAFNAWSALLIIAMAPYWAVPVIASATAASEAPAGTCQSPMGGDGNSATCAAEAAKAPYDFYVEGTSATTHWGEWSAGIPPILTVPSGSVVRMQSYTAVNNWWLHEESGYEVPDAMKEIYRAGCRDEKPGDPFPCGRIGPHLLTGPVAVEEAEPGDVLQVDIISAEPFLAWGWNRIGPGVGSLKYMEGGWKTIGLDLEKRSVVLPWASSGGPSLLPWNITGTGPFFGGMGTAPPAEMGNVSSVAPWEQFGGNIDNKLLSAGSTLYLPVNVKGDGHAVQGNGEVCVTALEASLVGDFRLTVRKDLGANSGKHQDGGSWVKPGASRPPQLRAETATHYVAMAFDPDLDAAEVAALEDLLDWMHLLTGHRREDMYRLVSLAGDMAVTQVVNGRKGIHIKLPKAAVLMNLA